MNILLTGVAGFIGSNLLDLLLENGHYVLGIDNFTLGKKEYISKKFNNKYTKIILGFFCSVVIYYLTNFFYVLGSTEKINLAVSIASPLLILFLINIYFVRNINAK